MTKITVTDEGVREMLDNLNTACSMIDRAIARGFCTKSAGLPYVRGHLDTARAIATLLLAANFQDASLSVADSNPEDLPF